MKIRFYPRDIGMFRNGDFDFAPRITLECRDTQRYKDFYDRSELIEYLKSRGIRLDDVDHPLEFYDYQMHHSWKQMMWTVKQWTLLGWAQEL